MVKVGFYAAGFRIAALSLAIALALTTGVDAQGRRGGGHGGGGVAAPRSAPAPMARPAAPRMRSAPMARPAAPRMRSAPMARRPAPAFRRAAPAARQMGRRQAMPRRFSPRQVSPRQVRPAQRQRFQRQRLAVPRGGGRKSVLRRGGASPRIGEQGKSGRRATARPDIRRPDIRKRSGARTRAAERRQQLIEQRQQRATERREAIAKRRENLKGDLNGRNLKGRDLKGKGPDRAIGDRNSRREQALVRRGKGERQLMLRNRALAERSARTPAARALARATFGGRYANRFRDGDRWRDRRHRRHWHRHHHHHHIHVIGWIGPLFWPYAYDDFVDYTFWPYAYDAFWPYAYDDVYEGFFGPYAVGGPVYYDDYVVGTGSAGRYASSGARPSAGTGRRTAARAPAGATATAQICTGETSGLTDWPIERIAEVVNPDETQRVTLDELRDAATRAVEQMREACPGDLPSTPAGRMAAMRQRLEAMREAVQIVRPALDKFYNALTDEQKASFNALEPQPTAADVKARKADISQACSANIAKTSMAPSARIERALRPSAEQHALLENLNAATAKAAELLAANCPTEDTLTPPGRLAAMEGRLDAMLNALDLVQPALTQFYDSLSDEQKARFNQLGTRQQATR
ncbi:MAG: hypothetical protein GEU95_18580 [Rhizobiales bacterium]|nr:hypothetical protein [Hyphomicrobiales bacterium]